MSLVVGDGLTRQFPGNEVFRDLAFRLDVGDHVGLVGANGAGKTTLLRIIAGAEEPTRGNVQRKRGLRTSYLPQEPPACLETTLWEAVHAPFADLRAREQELHELAERLTDPAAMERYSVLQAEFEARGGYLYEIRVQGVLAGLGFTVEDHAKPLAHLSGGQRTRAVLGRMLLEDPDLLLLDEPTNHLDLDAIEWVEAWLRDFKGTLLVVSHDRWFLDATANKIWDLSFGRLECYSTGYRAYVDLRAERERERRKVWEAQQDMVRRTEDFIARNIAGQRSREAKGRRTRLARFLDTEGVERPREQGQAKLSIDSSGRSGDRVLRTFGLVAGYDPAKPLVHAPDLEVWRGQRVAILGPNGNGKTTLLKTLRGDLEPLAGSVKIGASVEVGYLAQAQEEMDPEATVLDTILQVRGERSLEQVRTALGAYLFRGEDVFKRLNELSVGQKSRVALAWLALQGVNTLLLDEPTNHLDIPSQEELQAVLRDFAGTVLFVTHDRTLVGALATDVWVVEDGALHEVRGGWVDYQRWRVAQRARTVQALRTRTRTEETAAHLEADREERRRKKEREKAGARCSEVETEIPGLETRLKELFADIDRAGAEQNLERLGQLCLDYQVAEGRLKSLWDEWTRLSEVLES